MATSSKRMKLSLSLPDPEENVHATQLQDSVVKAMKECCDMLSSIDLLSNPALLSFIPSSHVIAWLFVKYGLKTINMLQAMEIIPQSLTQRQRTDLFSAIADISFSTGEIPKLIRLLEECGGEAAKTISNPNLPTVFAPPVNSCIECDKNLTSYHSCTVRHFGCSGLKMSTKYTLRCQPCGLLYNYSQYGNKRDDGFQYYSEERPSIEASDGVLVERQLLELQCSLA